MDYKRFLLGVFALFMGSANASTVLTATDSDVNFLFSPLPAELTLYMFDDDDNGNFAAAHAATDSLLIDIPSIVGISGPQSGNYLASNVNGNLTLTTVPSFVLAVYDSNTMSWIGDTNPVFFGDGNAAQLTFTTSAGVYVVDVVSAVPVPAAVWLFGSGLFGLVAAARRRNSQA